MGVIRSKVALGAAAAGLALAVILGSVIWSAAGELRNDFRLVENSRQPLSVADLAAPNAIVREWWLGVPALWQPPGLLDTEFRYFAVRGTTQRELIDSLNTSGLCSTYTCLPDPGCPRCSGAWGLEGELPAPGGLCYSPRTFTYAFPHFIVLPGWSPPADGAVKISLVQAWNALLGVIFTHESKHVAIAVAYESALNDQAHQQPTCRALFAFWQNPHIWDQLAVEQNAYHAQLRADCRPEIGCIPPGWMGW